MRLFLAFFLFLVITSDVAITCLVQWHGIVMCEMKESKSDDCKDSIEKEEQEKQVYNLAHHSNVKDKVCNHENDASVLYLKDENLLSQLFKFQPELPPEV